MNLAGDRTFLRIIGNDVWVSYTSDFTSQFPLLDGDFIVIDANPVSGEVSDFEDLVYMKTQSATAATAYVWRSSEDGY